MRTHASVYRQIMLDQAVRDVVPSIWWHSFERALALKGYLADGDVATANHYMYRRVKERFKELCNA